MPVISDFSGGIATGVDEFYLSPKHSVALVNANVNRIGLISIPNEKKVKVGRRWFYQFPIVDTTPQEFFITSSDNYRSYTEFNGYLCYSNGGPECRYTEGEMNEEETDFIWYDMGVDAPEGRISARPLVLEDLPGATATIRPQEDGYINIEHVKYRVVNTEDNTETIYIMDFEDNPGEAVVDWVVPEDTEVYRELVNVWDEPVGRYLIVNEDEDGNLLQEFTDGTDHIFYETVCERNSTVDNKASHRMVYMNGEGYTLQYSVDTKIEVEERTESVCDNCGVCTDKIIRTNKYVTTCSVDTLYKVGEDRYTPMQVSVKLSMEDPKSGLFAIASPFMYREILHILIRVGNKTVVYSSLDPTPIYETDTVFIHSEFHKCSTAEIGNSVYFFHPKEGKIMFFNGAFLTMGTMPVYPYATANNSVFSGRDGFVYAILNAATEANIQAFTLPDMTPILTGKKRIRLPRITSLGGTSGCNMNEGDYVILPTSRQLIRYNPDTNEVKKLPQPLIYPSGKVKGFVYNEREIKCVSEYVIAFCREDEKEMPKELDIKALNGSILYNVSQQTQDGLDGPIMESEHNEVDIEYGHMRVDLTDIEHIYDLRLYRTGGYLTRYTMVEDETPDDIYIDRRDDVTIALGREGLYEKVNRPPEGMQWLTAHRGHLFGAVGNKLYWSEPGSLNYWDAVTNMLLVDKEVTGLASGFNGLIIFMRGSIKLLAGSEPLQFNLKTVSMSKGTTKSLSIQAAGGGALFFSPEGLCFTDGITVKDLSYDMLGSIDFNVLASAVTSRSYFALVDNWMESSHEYVVLKQDINKDPLFTTLEGDFMETLGLIDGQLAHYEDGYIYESYSGDAVRTLTYRSGKITLNEPTMIKEWDRIRITGEFIGLLTVYLDDKIILSDVVDTETPYNVHIPKSINKGKSMSLHIEGAGDIYSIEYSITGRSTTK